jgi:hypothetical protein
MVAVVSLIETRTSRADLDRLGRAGLMGRTNRPVERSKMVTGALNIALGAVGMSLRIAAIGL